MITGSAAAVILPDLVRLYSDGRLSSAIDLFHRSALKCGAILIPIAGLFFLLAPEIMRAIYGPEYIESALYFRIFLVLLPLRVVTFGVLFQAAGRNDIVLVRVLIGLPITGAVCWLGVRLYGPVGAAWGAVLSEALYTYPFCMFTCARLFHTGAGNILPLRGLFRILAPTLGVYVAFGIVRQFLSTGSWIIDATLMGAGYTIVLVCLFVKIGILTFSGGRYIPRIGI